ncbi:uncharacterized protein MELLADRAFT_114101 [Melampsora larici-populina 98AG31]|uniref:Uncharacterized protein n=1 Tax=Melampsora larici-populina (strain 98AG31 / pathotype 3-4-7) TaxID=747676 RepID=F4SC65_MELLP|nr:uncharacterized protein MELLADRAFT_114101 [Melampsora larici-populina 98AG31]EGF97750.1 hypothetical protein MELLADRAFT_114101 [Melampsora larici-populina 98AG31]
MSSRTIRVPKGMLRLQGLEECKRPEGRRQQRPSRSGHRTYSNAPQCRILSMRNDGAYERQDTSFMEGARGYDVVVPGGNHNARELHPNVICWQRDYKKQCSPRMRRDGFSRVREKYNVATESEGQLRTQNVLAIRLTDNHGCSMEGTRHVNQALGMRDEHTWLQEINQDKNVGVVHVLKFSLYDGIRAVSSQEVRGTTALVLEYNMKYTGVRRSIGEVKCASGTRDKCASDTRNCFGHLVWYQGETTIGPKQVEVICQLCLINEIARREEDCSGHESDELVWIAGAESDRGQNWLSHVFWVGSQVISDQDGAGRFRLHHTHVVVCDATLRSYGLIIAGRRNWSRVRSNGSYRLKGEVVPGAPGTTDTLFKDESGTISMDNIAVDVLELANRVSVQSVGQIVDWFGRPSRAGGYADEVCTVLHRYCNHAEGRVVEFRATYVFDTNVSSSLSIDALNPGNIVNLRGSVVAFNSVRNQWEIKEGGTGFVGVEGNRDTHFIPMKNCQPYNPPGDKKSTQNCSNYQCNDESHYSCWNALNDLFTCEHKFGDKPVIWMFE